MRDDFFTWIKFNIPINIYQTLNVNDGNLNMIPKQKLIETIKELELNYHSSKFYLYHFEQSFSIQNWRFNSIEGLDDHTFFRFYSKRNFHNHSNRLFSS